MFAWGLRSITLSHPVFHSGALAIEGVNSEKTVCTKTALRKPAGIQKATADRLKMFPTFCTGTLPVVETPGRTNPSQSASQYTDSCGTLHEIYRSIRLP